MRKALLTFFVILSVLYAAVHLVLGSTPVQKRVVAELQAVLNEYGLVLEMESIEFSAFSPKAYLNRVKLSSRPGAKLALGEPLSIDKIRIQFRPISLLFGRIVIDELLLFHPRIQVPRADKLYRTAMGLFGSRGAIAVQRPSFDVYFYRLGVVDALFNIEAADPRFAVRSNSLTLIIDKASAKQRSVIVQSKDLEAQWQEYRVALTKVDVDLDLSTNSLRVNKGIVETEKLSVNVVGVSKLPSDKEKLPQNFNASYEIKGDLAFLKTVPGLTMPPLEGRIATSGTVRKEGELYSGKGELGYQQLVVDGYSVGSGSMAFGLDKRKVELSRVALQYSGGDFRSSKIQIDLVEHFPIQGELSFQGLLLEEILRGVRLKDPVVAMASQGHLKVSGTLHEPFQLKTGLVGKFHDLLVLDDGKLPKSSANTIALFGDGNIDGTLVFSLDKMDFDGEAGVLGGKVKGSGFVGFDDTSKVAFTAENASLTQLKRIAELELGGIARLNAEVNVNEEGGRIAGSFEVAQGSVAGLDLGAVRGEAFYQASLLTFESLEIPSLEPVRGNGYVDFKGDGTRYKFYVNARRTETDQIFRILKNLQLSFEIPKEGEVTTRLSVEGDGDSGVKVIASGQAKQFQWFDERWVSGGFNFTYQDRTLDLTKVLLTKPSGVLEVRGRFAKEASRLQLSTFGLEVSHFERFGDAPVTGEVAGELKFEGPKGRLFSVGRGELRLVKTKFRGVPVPDSTIKLRPDGDRLEYLFNLGNDRLRGRFLRSPQMKNDELLVYFQDYDFAPLMTLVLSRDVPPMLDLRATGDLSLSGDFSNMASLRGSGSITQLGVGLKGTPMQIHEPAQIKIDQKGLRVDSLFLQGEDSQLSLAINYEPDKQLSAKLDGRIDLQYLQPFIPGLDYGTGKVSLGLRMSGLPSRYQLLGSTVLENGIFRLTGFQDEFREVETRLSISQDRVNIDKFSADLSGGKLTAEGDIRIDRFESLIPNIRLHAERVSLRFQDYLSGKLSGEFSIRGKSRPYQLAGRCDVSEGALTRFTSQSSSAASKSSPVFQFDIQCAATEKLFVTTDIMQAEFRGGFHLLGNNIQPGLLGNAEALRGFVLFRDTRFILDAATVKFESSQEIAPRFRVSGRATVREASLSRQVPGVQEVQDYDVNLQVFGIPSDYKIRLTSSPPLLEGEIISLLVLGVTSRSQDGGNYVDFGSALVGQIPIQSKLKSELGVNIKLSNQAQTQTTQGLNLNPASGTADITAPTVQIQKDITDKTKLSYSNTLETIPLREFRIEQMLDDNLTVNATTTERSRGNAQPTQAYGLDFRYRFQFE